MSEVYHPLPGDYHSVIQGLDRMDLSDRLNEDAVRLIRSTQRLREGPGSTIPDEPIGSKDAGDRQKIGSLRTALEGKLVKLSNGNEYRIEIPSPRAFEGYPLKYYVFELVLAQQSSMARSFWNVHVQTPQPISFFLFERLCFRITGNEGGDDFYIRWLKINSPDKDRNELERLAYKYRMSLAELRPSHHYLSAGEANAAFFLQQRLTKLLGHPCVLASGSTFKRTTNDIVFESPRVESDLRVKNPGFIPDEKGIASFVNPRPESSSRAKNPAPAAGEKEVFDDRAGVMDAEHRIIYVLVRRVPSDAGVVTQISGHHGRAIEGVCEKLCDDAWLEKFIFPRFPASVPPPHFEFVCKAELAFDDFGKTSYTDQVDLAAYWDPASGHWRPTPQDS